MKKIDYMKKYEKIINLNSYTKYEYDSPYDEGTLNIYDSLYRCDALEELKKIFPNIYFSKSSPIKDLISLATLDTSMKEQSSTMSKYYYGDSYKFSSRYGRIMTKSEQEDYDKATDRYNQKKVERENQYSAFFAVCEYLNSDYKENKNNPEDIEYEEKIFNLMYNYGFVVRSKDTMLNRLYQNFQDKKQMQEKIDSIEKQNRDLKSEKDKLETQNKELIVENTEVKEKNSKLQNMLKTALTLCERVKNSRVGKLFFNKDIKMLNAPQNEDLER